MKKIILLRHGETTKDKDNKDRILTKKGVGQITKTAFEIDKLLTTDSKSIILVSDSKRTVMSANIISKTIGIETVVISSNLKWENFSTFAKDFSDPVGEYFKLVIDNHLPDNIENPGKIIDQFDKELEKVADIFETIIVVSHGGFMDIIAKFHPLFKIGNSKPMDFGEFIVKKVD